MKLSTLIRRQLDDQDTFVPGFKTAIIEGRHLEHWARAAERVESDQRAAWRSFYVACGVVGLLLVMLAARSSFGAAFGHGPPPCGAHSPPPPAVVRQTEVYEL
jgi:hypothetical protein